MKKLIVTICFLFLIKASWAVNQTISTNSSSQVTLSSANNAVKITATLTGEAGKDAIIFNNTAPGRNEIVTGNGVDIGSKVPIGSTGIAIWLTSAGKIISSSSDKLAINASAAMVSGGGTVFVYNEGEIRSLATNPGPDYVIPNIISMGSSTGSLNLVNSNYILGNMVGSNNGDIIKLVGIGYISGSITGGLGGTNLTIAGQRKVADVVRVSQFIKGSPLAKNTLNIGAVDDTTSTEDWYICELQSPVTDFQTINVVKSNNHPTTVTSFAIASSVSGVSNSVTIDSTTTMTIKHNGDLSGGGIINNSGIITLGNASSNSSIGGNQAMGTLNNSGIIQDVSDASNIIVNVCSLVNNSTGSITISSPNTKILTGADGSNVIMNAGTFNLNNGDLSSTIIGTSFINSGTLALRGTATIMGYSTGAKLGEFINTGSVTVGSRRIFKISGNFNNNDPNQQGNVTPSLSITTYTFIDSSNNSSTVGSKLEVGNVYNNFGTMNIGGDLSSVDSKNLSSLTNAANQTINVTGIGTIGATANKQLGVVTNNGTMNFQGGEVKTNTFINNNDNAVLNISSSSNTTSNKLLVKNFMYNTLGSIVIGESATNQYGDLSSFDKDNPAGLTNGDNQSITIKNNGQIGGAVTSSVYHTLGSVTNSGTIDADGGDVRIGDFTNNKSNALLRINKSNFYAGNINNLQGNIIISGTGVLRSIDTSYASKYSKLNNGINQTITVTGTAQIGSEQTGATPANQLGEIYNQGTISAGGGNIRFGGFTNNNESAALNITKGIFKVGNVDNILGSISIGQLGSTETPDLSSIDSGSPSTLNNAAKQEINVYGVGTIGQNTSLGDVINNGTINAVGGNITVGLFTNNFPGSELNIFTGIVKTGNINNKSGSINIIGNGLKVADLCSKSAVAGSGSSLTNPANQVINVTGNGSLGGENRLGNINNSGTITFSSSIGLQANDFTNNIGGNVTLTNNANTSTPIASKSPVGIKLSSINNSGTFTINNNGSSEIVTGSINNNSKAIFNLNGINNGATVLTIKTNGNFVNSANAILNLEKINLDLGASNKFENSGAVNAKTDITILNGNYFLKNGGTHNIVIKNGVANKMILSNGSCTIENGAKIGLEIIGDQYLFTNSDSILIFSGSSAATLGSNTIIEYNPLVNFTLQRSPGQSGTVNTDISLVPARTPYINVLSGNNNPTENANAVAAIAPILDSFVSNKVKGDLLAGLANLETLKSVDEVKLTAAQLLPEVNYVVRSGFETPSMVFDAAQVKLDKTARLDLDDLKDSLTGYAAGSTILSDDIVWVKVIGSSNLQKKRDSFLGYNANSYGSIFGMDSRVTDDLWLGLSGSYITSQIKSKDSPAKLTNVFGYQTTIYGTFSKQNYYIDGFAGMAINNYKTKRNIQIGSFYRQADAQFIGLQPSFKLVVGHIQQIDQFRLIPNLSWKYSLLRQRAYTESGAGNASLRVEHADLKDLECGIGIKISAVNHTDNSVINPDLHFDFLHNFKNQSQETVAEFIGGGGKFRLEGFVPSKDTYNLGAGLTIIRNQDLHFNINYELKMKNKFIGHSASMSIRYEL